MMFGFSMAEKKTAELIQKSVEKEQIQKRLLKKK
jgi:hypothetical protein